MRKYVLFSVFSAIILGFVKIISVIPFVRMAADDFSYADMAKQLGFFAAQKSWYFTWTGRYTSTFLQTLFTLVSGDRGQTIVYSLTTIVIFTVSLIILFGKIFIEKKDRTVIFSLSLLSLVSLYLLTPSKSECWYWLTGSVTYLWPIIFVVLVIGILLKKKHKTSDYIFASVLTFLIIGGNEAVAILLLATASINFVYFIFNKRSNLIGIIILLTSIISFSFVYFAPGNMGRLMSGGSNPMSLLGAILYSLQSGPGILYSIFANNFLYITSFFVVISYLFSTIKFGQVNISSQIKRIFITLSLPIFLSIIYILPAFKTLGRIAPDRSDINLALILLITIAIVSYYLGQIISELNLKRYYLFQFVIYIFALLLMISSLKLVATLGTDFYIAKNYSQSYDAVITQLKNASRNSSKNTVVVPVLPDNGLIPSAQIKGYPESWTNEAIANYYGLKAIISK